MLTKKKDKELTLSELAEEIKKQRDNPDFKEELKKNGLEFTIVGKNDKNENSEKSITNIIICPICFESTNNPNIKMEILNCGHCFCKNCLDELEKNNKNVCPVCKKKIIKKKIRILYI